jgi:hypothetical protein
VNLADLVKELRAPDQRGIGRVEHLENGPDSIDRLMAVEQQAVSILACDIQVFPALLQTPRYSAAVIKAANRRLTEEQVRRRMLLKSARAEFFLHQSRKEQAADTQFMIGGHAVVRAVSDAPEVHALQLRHLLKVAEHPRVTLRVLPSSTVTPGLAEHYTIYGLWNPSDGRRYMAYQESATGGWYSTRADDIARLHNIWQDAVDAAMSPSESLRFIREVLRSWDTVTRARHL